MTMGTWKSVESIAEGGSVSQSGRTWNQFVIAKPDGLNPSLRAIATNTTVDRQIREPAGSEKAGRRSPTRQRRSRRIDSSTTCRSRTSPPPHSEEASRRRRAVHRRARRRSTPASECVDPTQRSERSAAEPRAPARKNATSSFILSMLVLKYPRGLRTMYTPWFPTR